MQGLHALVVEDDPDIASVIEETLAAAGFEVTCAADGRAAVEAARSRPPDLVTLDITLPQMDGIEVLRHLRETNDCYVVIVSARTDEIDRLVGLEVGGDDYIIKPFSPRELRARVTALFRRPRGTVGPDGSEDELEGPQGSDPGRSAAPRSAVIDCGAGLLVDPDRREVQIDGKTLDLTRIEYEILAHLAERLGTVCTREEMVSAIWNSPLVHDHHLVDVHVANLRAKVSKHSDRAWLRTIRGIGYRLDRA